MLKRITRSNNLYLRLQSGSMAIKIFIVDDDPAMLEMINDFLQDKYSDAERSSFTTGEEALVELHKKPDVIILDYHLDSKDKTAMNGIDILKRIKELLPNEPVIFLSSQENPQVASDTIRFGAYDYIVKNESAFQRLEIMINNVTGHRSAQKQLRVQRTFNIILLLLLSALVIGFVVDQLM